MANADMNRLLDNARMRLPGALDTAIQYEFFSAMDDFFQKSNVWTENIQFDAVATSATYFQDPDAFTYHLVPMENGTINRLLGVVDANGFFQNAYMPTLGYLVLERSPNFDQTYTARVAKSVSDPVTREGNPVFPDWILEKYGSEILDGILGRMMSQIAKPYTSPQLANVHLKKFSNAISQAKVEASHQNVYRGQSWKFPQTFMRRRYNKF